MQAIALLHNEETSFQIYKMTFSTFIPGLIISPFNSLFLKGEVILSLLFFD